jgi:hypothetical protein
MTSETQKSSEPSFHLPIPTRNDLKRVEVVNTTEDSKNEGLKTEGSSGIPPEEKPRANSGVKTEDPLEEQNIEVDNTLDDSKIKDSSNVKSLDKSEEISLKDYFGSLNQNFQKLSNELTFLSVSLRAGGKPTEPLSSINYRFGQLLEEYNVLLKDLKSKDNKPKEPSFIKSSALESKLLNSLEQSSLPNNIKNVVRNEFEAKATIANQTTNHNVRDKFHNKFLPNELSNIERLYNDSSCKSLINGNRRIILMYNFITPVKIVSIEEAKIEVEDCGKYPVFNEIIRWRIEELEKSSYYITDDVFSDLEINTEIKTNANNIAWKIKRTMTFAQKDSKQE